MGYLLDSEVVEQVLDGDKESYGILLDRYQNLVFRIALIEFKNPEIAEDVVQEAFLLAYKNLNRLRNPSSYASWIAAITKNVCRGFRRKNKSKTVSLDYLNEVGIEPSNEDEHQNSKKEMIFAIREFVQKLPDKYRKIIELRYTEGFSCRELAAFLNLSRSAVMSRLYYARKAIIKMLKKEGLV